MFTIFLITALHGLTTLSIFVSSFHYRYESSNSSASAIILRFLAEKPHPYPTLAYVLIPPSRPPTHLDTLLSYYSQNVWAIHNQASGRAQQARTRPLDHSRQRRLRHNRVRERASWRSEDIKEGGGQGRVKAILEGEIQFSSMLLFEHVREERKFTWGLRIGTLIDWLGGSTITSLCWRSSNRSCVLGQWRRRQNCRFLDDFWDGWWEEVSLSY